MEQVFKPLMQDGFAVGVKTVYQCENCKEEVDFKDRFCRACGHDLKEVMIMNKRSIELTYFKQEGEFFDVIGRQKAFVPTNKEPKMERAHIFTVDDNFYFVTGWYETALGYRSYDCKKIDNGVFHNG